MTRIGFVFPGQGSQYVGMGKELLDYPLALEIFAVAESMLDKDIASLCLNGPEAELCKTVNTQISIFVMSYIYYQLLRNVGVRPDIVAGHSLGEYSALVAAEVIGFKEGLALVADRAVLMQEAAEKAPGAMIAVLCSDAAGVMETVEKLRSSGTIAVANYNCPGQLVLSGEEQLIQRAEVVLEEKGAKRVVRLPVSGAFHTSMMRDAEEKLLNTLKEIDFVDARVPLVSNSTARITQEAVAIKDALSRQMTSPVLWQQTTEKMEEAGVSTFVEVGPGKVLSGLIRRTDKNATVLNVEGQGSLNKVQAVLG